MAPTEDGLTTFLDHLASAVGRESNAFFALSDSAAFAAGLPLEPAAATPAPQAHVQALVQDFYRRQRQASMLVAGCIATSFVLTVSGITTLASFASRAPADADVPILLRGLPSEARLSAGQRNPSGAWIVKERDLGELTLSIDGDATERLKILASLAD